MRPAAPPTAAACGKGDGEGGGKGGGKRHGANRPPDDAETPRSYMCRVANGGQIATRGGGGSKCHPRVNLVPPS
eukprot:358232-Chlamydomonas_euryale.AAC.3